MSSPIEQQTGSHTGVHVESPALLLTVFGGLMVLTFLTVWVSGLDLGRMNDVTALGIATLKAGLVIWYFMHVRHSTILTKLAILTATFFVVLLFGITLADYLTRGWLGVLGR